MRRCRTPRIAGRWQTSRETGCGSCLAVAPKGGGGLLPHCWGQPSGTFCHVLQRQSWQVLQRVRLEHASLAACPTAVCLLRAIVVQKRFVDGLRSVADGRRPGRVDPGLSRRRRASPPLSHAGRPLRRGRARRASLPRHGREAPVHHVRGRVSRRAGRQDSNRDARARRGSELALVGIRRGGRRSILRSMEVSTRGERRAVPPQGPRSFRSEERRCGTHRFGSGRSRSVQAW